MRRHCDMTIFKDAYAMTMLNDAMAGSRRHNNAFMSTRVVPCHVETFHPWTVPELA